MSVITLDDKEDPWDEKRNLIGRRSWGGCTTIPNQRHRILYKNNYNVILGDTELIDRESTWCAYMMSSHNYELRCMLPKDFHPYIRARNIQLTTKFLHYDLLNVNLAESTEDFRRITV